MRFRSKDNAAIPVHRYIHDAPRYIMHDRGTIPPRFHYSFPTDTLYPSFSTYNLQYLSRAAIFPRTVRIFPNRIRTTTSKSCLEISPRRGNRSRNEQLFPSSRSLSLYLRIQLFLILFFTYLTFSEGKKLAIESYLHWVDSKDPRGENDARESSSRFIACRSESHGSRERVTKRRDATPGNHSNPEIFHRNERSLFSVNSL